MSAAAQVTERKKPGPKPGAKATTSQKPVVANAVHEFSAADRENPNKIDGQALRELAHRRGMAKSELEDMPDEKIRMQLRYITSRMSEESEA